jgi:Short C-terminal domain
MPPSTSSASERTVAFSTSPKNALGQPIVHPWRRERHDRGVIAAQLERLRELFVMGDISREEYVGRKRDLETALEAGANAPTHAEAILVSAARLLRDLGELWSRATPEERTEIAQTLFSSIRVRDGQIVSAKLAREEYLALVASSEARVWMARPEGLEPPTLWSEARCSIR